MQGPRSVVLLLVVALALVPALGFAASDLSAAPTGKHHHGRLHQQPDRAWRTLPSTLVPSATLPAVTRIERAGAFESLVSIPLVVRVPFVPPRG
jgi:hypothetical protein